MLGNILEYLRNDVLRNLNAGSVTSFGTVISFTDAFSASSSDKTWNLILRLKTRRIFRNLESFVGGRTTAKVKTINDEVRIQASKVPSPESSPEHRLPSPSNDLLPGGKDSLKLQELMDLCTHLSNKVLELESEVIDIKSTYKERIDKFKGRVDRLEEENRVLKELHKEVLEVVTAAKLITEVVTTAGATTTAEATKVSVSKKRRGVVIQDLEETTSTVVVHSEVQSKDKGKEEVNEEVTVPEKEVKVEGHKREGKSLKKEITKKQKIDEEAEELKSHL
nr:hypothetical protein [Tanacetum cinerariifolium]